MKTSCGTNWYSGSSRRTSCTRRRQERNGGSRGDGRDRGRGPLGRAARPRCRRRADPSGAARRGNRGRRARAAARWAGGDPHAQAGAPRRRRGDGRTRFPARRARTGAGRVAAPARRRRAVSTGGRRVMARAARACGAAPGRLRPRRRDGSPGAGARMRPRPSIIESFNFAIEGVVHVLRTQRNMRIHFAIAVAVLVVSRLELIALLLSITFVLGAEMINTAVEGTIDAATTAFDPMAKLAKDI